MTVTLQINNGQKVCFSSTHRYFCPGKTAEENVALYGHSYSPDGMGHNFQLEVISSADMELVDAALQRVHGLLHNRFLNDIYDCMQEHY